jgi:hypothetical protein
MDRLLSRTTLAVNGDAWNVLGKTGREPASAGNTAGLRTNGVNVSENDVVNRIGVDASALNEGFDAVSTDVGGVDL